MAKKRYTIIATCYDSKGKFLSRAKNSYTKSHPLQAHFASLVGEPKRIFLHAEIAALLKAGTEKVHTLELWSPDAPSVHPCKICSKAITAFGVKKVILHT